ncbi:GAF domain-containing protein [Halobaculum lipolyticum]|uniref:GAF domain-containing protein n=1 Tax=Halobaculum lipolyticum TaxID=3032001 RepID=A0ABD5WBA9_9EURY|nr:GAF domain-containing protein [Halobaculum sp. DT31]
MTEFRLLHVDPDTDRRVAVAERIEGSGRFVADPEFSGGTATDTLAHESYDGLLVGHPLPDGTDGFVRRVRGGYPDLPVVTYGDESAFDARTTRTLFRAGVTDHLPLGDDAAYEALVDRLESSIEAFHDRQRTRQGAETLRRLGDAVADAPIDVDEAIGGALDALRDTYDVDYAGLARIVDGDFRFVAGRGVAGLREALAETVPLVETYCRTTVEEGRTLASNADGGIGDRDRPAIGRRLDLECYLGTPVYVDGDLFGTLCVVDRSRRQGFARWERTGIELAARWVARELEHDREKARLRTAHDAG